MNMFICCWLVLHIPNINSFWFFLIFSERPTTPPPGKSKLTFLIIFHIFICTLSKKNITCIFIKCNLALWPYIKCIYTLICNNITMYSGVISWFDFVTLLFQQLKFLFSNLYEFHGMLGYSGNRIGCFEKSIISPHIRPNTHLLFN